MDISKAREAGDIANKIVDVNNTIGSLNSFLNTSKSTCDRVKIEINGLTFEVNDDNDLAKDIAERLRHYYQVVNNKLDRDLGEL